MLADELRQLADRAKLAGCTVAVWAQQQDADVQELLAVLSQNPKVNLTEALSLIRKHYPDLPFKRTSFMTHMRGTCACQAS